MCRLFGFQGSKATDLTCALLEADNALLRQSALDSRELKNSDGWGIGYYTTRTHTPVIKKSSRDAATDPSFKRTANKIKSSIILAHVRRATKGVVQLTNTHPFQHKDWIFCHNGDIANFKHCKQELSSNIKNNLARFIRGETDSELSFYLFLSFLDNNKSKNKIIEALQKTIILINDLSGKIDKSKKSKLNFLASNGDVLVASRHGNTLYCLNRHSALNKCACYLSQQHRVNINNHHQIPSVTIASEPLTRDEHWQEIAENSIILTDSSLQIYKSNIH